ncbi:MAG: Rpn family recombination-promoting nuclease/putative transposase [Deltaproteobacteria bacterium]|jgi:hypothetical protein|nr:Rpn family recombination-promoting nuclease/putative transposase [Deltaproteobacteria bacterium]
MNVPPDGGPTTGPPDPIQPDPLADPVITALFDDAARIGEATLSLANAVLADAGREPVRKILRVTPQRTHPAADPDGRPFLIDVEAVSGAGEFAHIEIRLKTFHRMTELNLPRSFANLYGNARRGGVLSDVVKRMPRVIAIDILDFVSRPSPADFHQLAGFLFLKEPVEWASDRLEIHMIQLPLFKAMAPDFKNPLHCWLTAIARARDQGKSLKEVVEMDTALKEFREADPGFAQFVDRYGIVASTPEMLKAYNDWQIAQTAWGGGNRLG